MPILSKPGQTEFKVKMNCDAFLKCVDGTIATYHVSEKIIIGDRVKETMYEVVFNCDNHDINS